VEAHKVVIYRGSHIFLNNRLTDGSEVSLTRWLPFTPQEDFWYSFLIEAVVEPRTRERLEGLDEMKNPMTASGIEPATFRLIA
jgi:hypothetical protein